MAFPGMINVSINGETAEYLVADHPVKSINGVYADGVKQTGEYSQREVTVLNGVEVTVEWNPPTVAFVDNPERQGVPPASLHHEMRVWVNMGGGRGWMKLSNEAPFELPETRIKATVVTDRGEGLKRGTVYEVGRNDTLRLFFNQALRGDKARIKELFGSSDSRVLGSLWIDRKGPGGCRCARYERGLAPVYILDPAYYTDPTVHTFGLHVVPRHSIVEYLFLVGEEPGEITL